MSTSRINETVESLKTQVMQGKLTRREAMIRGAALGLSIPAMLSLNAVVGGGFAQGVLAQSTPAASPVSSSTPDPNAKSGGTLKVGLQSDPAELDPGLTQLTAAWHVIEHVYEGLVAVSPSLEPVPALAESWEISPDGLTYTFRLRTGVKFHNGREFVADDVKYSFERILDPATASPNASELASISKIEASDPTTVVLTLKSADSSFMAKLMGNAAMIVPKEEVEKNGDLMQTMVGTGPFKFVEYIPNSSVKLEKNGDYWLEGRPYLDGLELQVITEATSRTAALVQGSVDFIEYAPVQDIPTFKKDSSLVVTGDQNTNIRYAALNISRAPFDKLEVRQAIAKVVDRGPIIDSAVFGYGTATNVIFPETFWAGAKSDIPAPDVEGAKALLEKAGVASFTCKIQSWASYAFLSNAAVVLQEQLKQIGIEAELDLQENAIYLDNYFKGEYDISVTGTSAYVDPNDVLFANFGTGETNNGMKYSNPEVDKLLADGIAETEQTKRAEIYGQLQAILLEDLPWINLFIANQYEAMKAMVKGYIHIPTGTNSSIREVWLDQ